MAVRHGYGKIAGADALVFAYDTGDTRNSYKGRPTTNYGPASFGDWGTESSAERIATGNTYNGQPTYNCRTVVGESYRGVEKTISGLRTAAGSSGTVTMSCMVRNNNSSAYNMYAYIGHDFGSTRTIAANSDWQKVQWTVNQSSMNNDYVEFRPYTNNASVYLEMTMPMVEVNVTYATQFTDGTRSSTQGLLDLTGNRTIDLANAGFDSNAQISLDGSNDSFETTSNLANLTDLASGTIELVFKWSAGTDYTVLLHAFSGTSYYGTTVGLGNWTGTYGDESIYLFVNEADGTQRVNSLYRNGHYTYRDGVYHHVVFTVGSNTVKGYIDGTEMSLTSSSGTKLTQSSVTKLQVGKREYGGGTGFHSGEVPVVKIYSRALTAAEVRNNYNQYRTRFNI
jgi:hypothetical protein